MVVFSHVYHSKRAVPRRPNRRPANQTWTCPKIPNLNSHPSSLHSHKPLPTRIRRDGFHYRQIAREGSAAIYEQGWSGYADPSVGYEVIRIRCRDGFQIGDRFVEPAEVYPNSEAWGLYGFSFTDRDAAFAKLRELAWVQ